MKKKFYIETQRLVIRALQEEDFENAYQLYKDPIIMKYIGPGKKSKSESKKRFDQFLNHQKNHGFSFGPVLLKKSNTFMGLAGLVYTALDDTQDEIELGYCFLQEYWNQGYATEISKGCLKWAFENLSIPKIMGYTDPNNLISQKVLKKIGMKSVGESTYRENKAFKFEISREKYRALLKKS